MIKPRLLDLFCGAVLYYNYIYVIIKAWLKLYVGIVAKHLQRKDEHANTVQYHAPIILFGLQRSIASVRDVVSNFLSKVQQMPIVSIVLRRVPRKQIRSIHYVGIRNIPTLWINTIRRAWLRILVHGGISNATNAWKLSAYWGANV